MKRHLSLFLCLLLFSCAKDININYQDETANTGRVVLIPNRSTERTFVTVDDNLLVKKRNVKSVTISNIPEGSHTVNYVSENSAYKHKLNAELSINIQAGKEVTKLIEVPPYSAGYWIYISLCAIIPPLVAILVTR